VYLLHPVSCGQNWEKNLWTPLRGKDETCKNFFSKLHNSQTPTAIARSVKKFGKELLKGDLRRALADERMDPQTRVWCQNAQNFEHYEIDTLILCVAFSKAEQMMEK
jgi:hypothetical protein